MIESHKDRIRRVEMMAGGTDDTWDLSDNDCCALQTVLEERSALLKAAIEVLEGEGEGMRGIVALEAAVKKAGGRP